MLTPLTRTSPLPVDIARRTAPPANGTTETGGSARPTVTTSPNEPENERSQTSATSKAATDIELQLGSAELAQLRELQVTDRKVRAHEAAHAAAGGDLAGARSFSYTTGPDGRRYAVAGEVSISFGRSSDPSATMSNARQVRAAALAPIDPSAQDLSVAAQAQQIIIDASRELVQLQTQERTASNTRTETALQRFSEVENDAGRDPQIDLLA